MIAVSLLSSSFRNVEHRAMELSALSQSGEQSECDVFPEVNEEDPGNEEFPQQRKEGAIERWEAKIESSSLSELNAFQIEKDLRKDAFLGVHSVKGSKELLDKLHQAKGETKKDEKIEEVKAAIQAFKAFRRWNVYTVFAFQHGTKYGYTTKARMSVALSAQFVVQILMAGESPGDSGWCPTKQRNTIL